METSDVDRCGYCGKSHPGIICPRIKAIEYEDGIEMTIKRVEFFAPIDYPQLKLEEPEADYPRLSKI
jgi:hypothetical protein